MQLLLDFVSISHTPYAHCRYLTIGGFVLFFNDWLVHTYEKEWKQIKDEMKVQEFSMEVILDIKQSLYDDYLFDVKEGKHG